MSGYKEFEGKNLDEAIQDACAFYDATREKLEIEILNDAKGGIFGLVGAKKARIRARLVHIGSLLDELSGTAKGKQQKRRPDPAVSEQVPARRDADETSRKKPARELKKPAPCAVEEPLEKDDFQAEEVPPQLAVGTPGETRRDEGRPRRTRNQGQAKPLENSAGRDRPDFDAGLSDADLDADDLRRVPFDQLDAAELERVTREVITRLTVPFLGDAAITVSMGDDRVRVSISNVEDPGLLIGRDGQTLASLQYLATRMVSNRMKALLRVQVDAGDYRERQDERLRELALSLAEKVKAGGRPQVTRPLSSYHRRVIHLTLQDDPLIQTHSKGEGEMKRVMVARRRPDKNA